MKKKSLKDFGISENQYARYLKYKLKFESKNNLFGFRRKILIIIGIPLIFFLLKIGAWENITKYYNKGSYLILINLLFSIVIFAWFMSMIFWNIIVGFLIQLDKTFGFDKLAEQLYKRLNPTPRREYFFNRCEKYELEEKNIKTT